MKLVAPVEKEDILRGNGRPMDRNADCVEIFVVAIFCGVVFYVKTRRRLTRPNAVVETLLESQCTLGLDLIETRSRYNVNIIPFSDWGSHTDN